MATQERFSPDINKRNPKNESKKSSSKNAQAAKRKYSAKNLEEKHSISNSKKRKTYLDQVKSKEKTQIDKVKVSDEEEVCSSVRSVPKGGKTKGKNNKTETASRVENRGNISSNWESSDDQIPLSEISKRDKTKQNDQKKLPIKSKGKKGSVLMGKGKAIEGMVKIIKNVTDKGSPFKHTLSKSKLSKVNSPVKMKGQTVEENIDKSLVTDQASNSDAKRKLPVKRKITVLSKVVEDFKVAKESHTGSKSSLKVSKVSSPLKMRGKHVETNLAKDRGFRSVKTQSGEDKVGVKAQKEETKGNISVKETLVEKKASKRKVEDFEDSDEEGDSDMDWEDVAEMSGIVDDIVAECENNVASTSSNVEVTIKVPGNKSKCGKPSQEEIRKWIQRKINRVKKENQTSAHKVHLLALLAVGLRKNEMCNNSLVQAIGLSLLPDIFIQRNALKTWDIPFLTRVTTWLKNKAPDPGDIHTGNSEATYLMRVLEKKVYLLIAILRALGLCVRLVMSLQVLSNKVTDSNESKKTAAKQTKTPARGKQTPKEAKTAKQPSKKIPKQTSKGTLLTKLKSKSTPAASSSRNLREKAKVDYTLETKSEYFSEEKTSDKEFSDDDDFECPLTSPKRGRTSSSGGSRLSGEYLQDVPADVETSGVIKRGRDIWIEVYLEKEKRWICIDGDISSVNQPEECEKLATKPMKYAMAFDNDCSIKDVTRRYAIGWLTTTPKLRVDPDWLTETLNFYRTKNLKRDKKEDSQLKARLLQKPLPQTVSEYKNHPLYVLERHLLKFQAIYPESATTLGFCRGEAVYSRDCVHTLHTRELWMKEARVVKTGEQPYKVVKGRKTKRRMLENVGELKAELFGRWQTEDYIPPPVVDGKVPRNEYGNVELFKPSMLPAGACHIQIPGIHRIARKLNIDAAAAIVGFDFHGGFNHPIIDGVVVGEEFKEQLLLAWDKEQQEKVQREKAKREKRVLDNWTHLVRSLRIRERLKRKYKMEEKDLSTSKNEANDANETEDVTDISLSWPLNKQEGKTARDDEGHCHVFLPASHVQDAITGEWSKSCACGFKEPLDEL